MQVSQVGTGDEYNVKLSKLQVKFSKVQQTLKHYSSMSSLVSLRYVCSGRQARQ